MPKKTFPKPFLNLLFFILLALVFFATWGKEFSFDSWTKKTADEPPVQETTPRYSLEPLVVELAGRYLKVTKREEKRPQLGTRKKYLRIAVDIEVKDETVKKELEKKLSQIKDAVSEIVSAKRVKDIETAEGKTALSDEMVRELNRILQREGVTQILYREFIILS